MAVGILAGMGKVALGGAKMAGKAAVGGAKAVGKGTGRAGRVAARRSNVQKIMGGGDKKSSPKITAEKFLPTKPGGGARITSEQVQSLHIVNVKLGEVSNGLKDQLVLSKVREGLRKRKAENERRRAREAALEAEKKKGGGGGGIIAKGMGIFDRVFHFLITFLIGSVIMKLVDKLQDPEFLGFLNGFIDFISWVGNIGGKILDGLATFIDWAYGLYDQLEQWVGNTFGEEALEKFKTFTSSLKDLIAGFLVWKLVFEKIFKQIIANIKRVFGFVRRIVRTIWTKVRRLIGRKARMFFAKLAQRAGNFVRGIGSRVVQAGRGLVSRAGALISRGGTAVASRLGGTAVGRAGGLVAKIFGKAANIIGPAIKGAMPAVKGFFGRIPILGPLIVGIVSLMSGEPLGQALFKAVGSALGGAIGAGIGAVGGPVAFIGLMIGEMVGAFVGDLLYYAIMERNPGKALTMLVDTFKGIFGFLTKIPIIGDLLRIIQQGGNILFNFGKWVFLEAIPWATAKIGNIGRIIGEWIGSGVERWKSTFPMFEIPNVGIQDMLYSIFDIEWPGWVTGLTMGQLSGPIFPMLADWRPDFLENLPRLPRILGFLWQNVPGLSALVDDNGEVKGFPKFWLLGNPMFLFSHTKNAFFPGTGGSSAEPSIAAPSGGNTDAQDVSESTSYEEGGEGEPMIIPIPIITPANTVVTSGGGGGSSSSSESSDDPMVTHLYQG